MTLEESSETGSGVHEVDDEDVAEESDEDMSEGRGSGGDNRGRVKPGSHHTSAQASGMWRVVGLCRKLSEKAHTFWLIR